MPKNGSLNRDLGVSILFAYQHCPPLIRVGPAQILRFPKENTIPERGQRGLGGGSLNPKKSPPKKYKALSYSNREGIAKNWKLLFFPMKSRVEKKMVPNLHFWAKCFSHFDDLQSNLFFPRSVRTDFSRSVVFNLVQRDLLKEIRFFTKKVTKKVTKKW